MSEKNEDLIEEEKNEINTDSNNIINDKKDDLDIRNMSDPLTALKEVEEKEINEKNLTDISKEINKKKEEKEKKENGEEEDEDSEKNSEEHLMGEQKKRRSRYE
jgi:hypothetical protein